MLATLRTVSHTLSSASHQDTADRLDGLRVQAYNRASGRFLSRDPLGRAPLFLTDNPYVYAGANPLSNVDPSGQMYAKGAGSGAKAKAAAIQQATTTRIEALGGMPKKGACNSTCQEMNGEAQKDLIWGITKALLGLGGAVLGCAFGPLCLAYVRAATPWILDGLHGILDALDIFYRYDWGGALASGWTLLIRAGKVAIDVLQVLLAISDIGDMVKTLLNAKNFFSAFLEIVKAEFSKAPEENKFWGIGSSLIAIGDMLSGGALTDFADLQEVNSACSASTAHCFG